MPDKNIAMILIGIPKHFDIVWRSYYQKVIQTNLNFHFDVYFNFYNDVQIVTSIRDNEINAIVDTLEKVNEQFHKTGTKVTSIKFSHVSVITTDNSSSFSLTYKYFLLVISSVLSTPPFLAFPITCRKNKMVVVRERFN